MTSLLIILLGTVLIQNSAIVLGKSIEQTTVRGNITAELRIAIFTLLTLTLSSVWGHLLNKALMTYQLQGLRTLLLLFGLALIFFISRIVFKRISGTMSWPNVNTHLSNQCAMLGIALFSADYLESPYEALTYGICTAVVLSIMNASFLALRQRIDMADVPLPFKGIPIALISVGFMALGLLGFSGMVRH